jgi:2-polyprenyl-6-methoxyphenol hydroxylase-like FAD-dependent oxidoreductase
MSGYDVAVVGGGPVGMWLAAELHRGGVRPVVLERHAERPAHSKALTIYPRTMEQFAMRGIADRWLAEGTPVPSTHFAILRNRLDMSFLDTRYPYTLFLPQRRTEELLEEHLAELGVPYLKEHTVTGLRQDSTGVDLDVISPSGPASFRTAYVAGCDGARSVVRAAAGIDFTGTPDTWRTIMGDIELTSPPRAPALTLNQPGGSLYMVALGGGRWRLATIDHATMYELTEGPVTFEELRASALRIAETDFGMRETADAWLSRVGNATRQAACYRAGRVFLAGDAAHIHYPAGGQGLNLGLQDATNLAWKLAAEIRGWAPPGLLDTYHAERHAVGLDVVDSSLAQCGLFANASREGITLRDQFNAILAATPALCRDLATGLSGLAIRYPATGHLAGQRVPDLDLRGAPAASVSGLLHPAKFLLLTQGAAEAVPAGYEDRLAIVTAQLATERPDWASVRSLLIRPDGYIAWAADTEDSPPFRAWLGALLSHASFSRAVRASR